MVQVVAGDCCAGGVPDGPNVEQAPAVSDACGCTGMGGLGAWISEFSAGLLTDGWNQQP